MRKSNLTNPVDLDKTIKALKSDRYKSSKYRGKRLYVLTQLFTGLRFSDIENMTFGDIVNHEYMFKTQRKNKKDIRMRYPSVFREYIQNVYDSIEYITDESYLTARNYATNKPTSYKTALRFAKALLDENDLIRESDKETNNTVNIGTHSFRKAFATRYYDRSEDKERALEDLCYHFNHSSVSMTRRYIGLNLNQISKSLEDVII
tara:strand:+ start:135 stop:749 length:615 start_codon:yes stop_codon:yes gene_type:complete